MRNTENEGKLVELQTTTDRKQWKCILLCLHMTLCTSYMQLFCRLFFVEIYWVPLVSVVHLLKCLFSINMNVESNFKMDDLSLFFGKSDCVRAAIATSSTPSLVLSSLSRRWQTALKYIKLCTRRFIFDGKQKCSCFLLAATHFVLSSSSSSLLAAEESVREREKASEKVCLENGYSLRFICI